MDKPETAIALTDAAVEFATASLLLVPAKWRPRRTVAAGAEMADWGHLGLIRA
ncbi:MAG: hypothetical protein ACI30P_01145 [Muribaculaceae bacterium]